MPDDADSSSSSSSDDETRKRLQESVDSSFLKDDLFHKKPKSSKTISNGNTVTENNEPPPPPPLMKSNRYINEEETTLQSDIQVSDAMKRHIGGKISKLIAASVEFYDIENPEPVHRSGSKKRGVRLLSDCDDYLKLTHDSTVCVTKPRVPIYARNPLPEEEDILPLSDKEKLKAAAIDVNNISSGTRFWIARKRSKPYEYIQRSAKFPEAYLSEKSNEFFATRLKNHWNESKIRLYKKKMEQGHPRQ